LEFFPPVTTVKDSEPAVMLAVQSRSWAEPLRILLQKELTLTDVGELGRIILPKVSPLCPFVCLDLLHMNYSRIRNSGPDS
jgi:hypothetical protein